VSLHCSDLINVRAVGCNAVCGGYGLRKSVLQPRHKVMWCAGLLPDPEVSLGAMGIAFNTHAWIFMLGNGMGSAASTRVSNALGAGRPDDAKLSAEVCGHTRPAPSTRA